MDAEVISNRIAAYRWGFAVANLKPTAAVVDQVKLRIRDGYFKDWQCGLEDGLKAVADGEAAYRQWLSMEAPS